MATGDGIGNLTDYLLWRGDISLRERPLTEVDALVLATLSYVDLAGMVPSEAAGGSVTMAQALGNLLEQSGGDVAPYVRSLATIDASYLRALADSRRFGELSVGSYVDVMDPERAVQFAALEVALPAGSLGGCERGVRYVSFRGTDLTLAGWREDFMLSFEVTGAQLLARDYLSRALRRAARADDAVITGGHSKGGNLASYAVANVAPELAARVLRCYAFDAPSVDARVASRDARDVLGPSYVRIQPEYSVIGQLFDRPDEPRSYVRSFGTGLMQHDPLSWQVTASGFVRAAGLDPDARAFDEALDEWMSPVGPKDREGFIWELFDILGAGGPLLSDVTSREGLPKVVAAANAASEKNKRLALNLVGSIVSKQVDRTQAVVRGAYADAVKAARQAAAGAAETIASALPRRREGDARSAESRDSG
ncbi:MAG: Mbeg1-like protein [Parafannyhessea sp.]|uniref:Mbeg1-like protein n=1 Tax=Parafannyhessea sp. TaxID=2847324 RepID=UPI003F0ED468